MGFELWGNTLMGIPDMTTLPPYYIMSSRFFILSLTLLVLFFFLFSYVTIFSFYRVIKKINNPHVYSEIDNGQEKKNNEETKPMEGIEGQMNRDREESIDPLGYGDNEKTEQNFQDKQEIQGKKARKKQRQNRKNKQNQDDDDSDDSDDDDKDDVSDDESLDGNNPASQEQIASRIKLFGYQDSLFKIAPMCLIFVFTLNNFTLDYISLVSVILMIVTYLIFNMFNIAQNYPMLKNIYLVGALAGFIPHFINQQDFTI